MKIDIGESLVYSYLRHVKHCSIVQINWKPSGNWVTNPEHLELSSLEFERIQRHPAFVEIFKTGFEHTIRQTEIDVLGIDQEDTIYVANVTFHENGINFGAKTDTRNRVIKGLLRAYLAMKIYFPGKKYVFMFCSPKVMPNTEEILSGYFNILKRDFEDEQARFIYLSNEQFRDRVMMDTLDCIQDEFDTSELFLRSFKLLTVYAEDQPSEAAGEVDSRQYPSPPSVETPAIQAENPETARIETSTETETEIPAPATNGSDSDREKNEILKVLSRIPKWFKHPDQTNSKILITYLNLLEKTEEVSLEQLSNACADVPRFQGNFAQMNNIAEKNHGKVFAYSGGLVTLWEPVKDFIIQQYIDFKKSYYKQ